MKGMCTDEYLMLAVTYLDKMRNSINDNGIDNYDILNKTAQSPLEGPVKESREYSDELPECTESREFLDKL
jgi:hypothetical protein